MTRSIVKTTASNIRASSPQFTWRGRRGRGRGKSRNWGIVVVRTNHGNEWAVVGFQCCWLHTDVVAQGERDIQEGKSPTATSFLYDPCLEEEIFWAPQQKF